MSASRLCCIITEFRQSRVQVGYAASLQSLGNLESKRAMLHHYKVMNICYYATLQCLFIVFSSNKCADPPRAFAAHNRQSMDVDNDSHEIFTSEEGA